MKLPFLIQSSLLLTQIPQRIAAIPCTVSNALGNTINLSDLLSGLGPPSGRTVALSYPAKKEAGALSSFSDSRSLGSSGARLGGRLTDIEVLNPVLQKRVLYIDPEPRPLYVYPPRPPPPAVYVYPPRRRPIPPVYIYPQPQLALSTRFRCPKNWRDVAYDKDVFTAPKRDRSLFYAGVGAQDLVEAIAKEGAYQVLISLLDKSYVRFAMGNCQREEFWRLASAAMAHTSSGVVTVMMPKISSEFMRCYFESKPDGRPTVWKEVEYPALRRNQKVTKVLRLDKQDVYNGRQRSEGKGIVLLDRREMKYACQ